MPAVARRPHDSPKKLTPPRKSPSATQARAIGRSLLTWYARHRRDLPWRRTSDPYAIWVSEMMLQQTQVSTVIPYFERWMQRFPDIASLARASQHAVLHSWQGLGYYSRARNLQRAAQLLNERCQGLPDEVSALLELPGIGPYSAGAIASIAFGKREPVVDGNVIRVLCRLLLLEGDPSEAGLKRALWDAARSLVPPERPGDFNQAMMELGATICTPRAPDCARCPLRRQCAALKSGRAEELPTAKARAKPTPSAMVAAIAVQRGRVLVMQLPEDAPRWAGMWQFPNLELARDEEAASGVARAIRLASGLEARPGAALFRITHSVTRFRIVLEVYQARVHDGRKPKAPARWQPLAALGELAMPAAHRKIALRLAGNP